jgi:hypothetical protein
LLSEQDIKVDELFAEVKAGRFKLKFHVIRDYCRCIQKKAAKLKRLGEKKLKARALSYGKTYEYFGPL